MKLWLAGPAAGLQNENLMGQDGPLPFKEYLDGSGRAAAHYYIKK